MTRSLLALGLVGCVFPAPPPTDTADGWDDTAETGWERTETEPTETEPPETEPVETGSTETEPVDTGSGGEDTGEAPDTGVDLGTHGGVGEITAVWFVADFGIDDEGELVTVETADGPVPPRLQAFFMNTSWAQDLEDIENYCVVTFDAVETVDPEWVASDPDAWFGFDLEPDSYTSNCAAAWGDVYGDYFAGWTGGWGVSVGGDLVHLTYDLPGYGSQFGDEEPWVFDARAVHSTDGILGDVDIPDIDFWTYAYTVDSEMNVVLDGAGDPIPLLDADVYLGDHTLASGWYVVTGAWLYGIDPT